MSHFNSNNNSHEPNNVVILKGLSSTTLEETISDSIKAFSAFETIRLKKDSKTQESRGFAFVEFKNTEQATKFINESKGKLVIEGKKISVSYSANLNNSMDWICEKCSNGNFSWRNECFKCHARIPDNPKFQPSKLTLTQNQNQHLNYQQHQDSQVLPGATLLLRDISSNTTEETIEHVFSLFNKPIKSIRIAKKKYLIAFVEYYKIQDAESVLKNLDNKIITIDGSKVRVVYAKCQDKYDQFVDPVTGLTQSEMEQWLSGFNKSDPDPPAEGYVYNNQTGLFYNSESGYFFNHQTNVYFYYDADLQCYFSYDSSSNSYLPYTPTSNPIKPGNSSSTTTTSNSKDPKKKVTTTNYIASKSTFKKVGTEIEKWNHKGKVLKEEFIKEEEKFNQPKHSITHGPNNYHLNSNQNQTSALSADNSNNNNNNNNNRDGDKDYDPEQPIIDTVPISEPVVKINPVFVKPVQGVVIQSQPIKFNVTKIAAPLINKAFKHADETNDEDEKISQFPTKPHHNRSHQQLSNLNSIHQQTSHHHQKNQNMPSLNERILCKLCDRVFTSIEALDKHERESQLHKANLEKQRIDSNTFNKTSQDNDLAPITQQPKNDYSSSPSSSSSSTMSSLKNSIGFKLLQKSGWVEGTGLGKDGGGATVDQIDLRLRNVGAGLGSEETNADSRFQIQAGDDYQTKLRKKASLRFQSLGGKIDENNPFFKK